MPDPKVANVFKTARRVGVDLITSHWRRLDSEATVSIPDKLEQLNLMGQDLLLSHGNGSTDAELRLLADAGCYIASTPPTESQMGHGEPTYGPSMAGDTTQLVCLGADCNSNNCSIMVHSIQLYLAVARSHRNSRMLSKGQFPRDIKPTTEQVFNMATIEGAKAIGLEHQIGNLKPGKQADILIFDATSPAMVPAADHDPVVAVVQHASPAELEIVIIRGEIKKMNGDLLPADVILNGSNGLETVKQAAQDGKLTWSTVSKHLRKSREAIEERARDCNMEAAKTGLMDVLGLSKRQLEDILN